MKPWRVLKWTITILGLASVVGVTLFIWLFYYLTSDSCDSGIIYSTQNTRGDIARSEIEICKFFATVVNTSITVQVHDYPNIWPKKKIIDYDSADNRDPVLRWLNDATLSVDLGRVYWVSARANRVGNIHIIYIYSKVDASP
jgi:hypothetical protein